MPVAIQQSGSVSEANTPLDPTAGMRFVPDSEDPTAAQRHAIGSARPHGEDRNCKRPKSTSNLLARFWKETS